MVDLRMLARPAMWQACLLTLLVTVTLGMVTLLLPQLLAVSGDGYGFDADTTDIGLYLLPGAIAGAMSDAVGGVAARRFGARAVVAVAALATAAVMFTLAVQHDSAWQLALAKTLTAFAAGIATTALLAGTATAVDPGDTGIATSLLVVTRVIGVVVGAQIAGALLAAGTDAGTGLPADAAFTTGFAVTGVTAALGLLLVRATRASRPPRTPSSPLTPPREGRNPFMTGPRTVLISGASVSGPALAYWLHRAGFAVTVVEKADALRGGGYPVDIRGTATEVIRRTGLWPRLREAHIGPGAPPSSTPPAAPSPRSGPPPTRASPATWRYGAATSPTPCTNWSATTWSSSSATPSPASTRPRTAWTSPSAAGGRARTTW